MSGGSSSRRKDWKSWATAKGTPPSFCWVAMACRVSGVCIVCGERSADRRVRLASPALQGRQDASTLVHPLANRPKITRTITEEAQETPAGHTVARFTRPALRPLALFLSPRAGSVRVAGWHVWRVCLNPSGVFACLHLPPAAATTHPHTQAHRTRPPPAWPAASPLLRPRRLLTHAPNMPLLLLLTPPA